MRNTIGVGVAAALVATGCVDAFGTNGPRDTGEALGTFHVGANAVSNTCGQGALGSTETWEFEVKISVASSELLWDAGGNLAVGSLSKTGAFHLASGFTMNMRDKSQVDAPPCSIAREDRVDGDLEVEGEKTTGFQGTMGFTYTPTTGSECSDLVYSETPTFAALPCAMVYALDASIVSEDATE